MIYVYVCPVCKTGVELQRRVAEIDDPVECGLSYTPGHNFEIVLMDRIRFHKGTGVHFKGEGWPGKDNAGRRNWQRNQDITDDFEAKTSKQKTKKEGTYDDPAPKAKEASTPSA